MRKAPQSTQPTELPRIVVIGGGAGGLELASRLSRSLGRKKLANITLVDRSLSHMWKPSLHEYAAGTKGTDSEISFLEHANRHGYQFRLGRLQNIDFDNRVVMLGSVHDSNDLQLSPNRQIPFDYLVLAIGSRSNDFGCKGVSEHCWFLDTPDQAKRLQTELLNTCLRFETGVYDDNKAELNVCIVGGGATGVELAAELREASEQLGLHGIDKLKQPRSFRISLLEAGPRLLAALPEDISEKVQTRLQDLDIQVHTIARVAEVGADEVVLEDGKRIAADMTIWSAGIKAPEILKSIAGLPLGSLGRISCERTLQVIDKNSVFAMGDCADVPWIEIGQALPPRAQVASQQAHFMCKQLSDAVKGAGISEFVYVDRGSLVSISDRSAVGALMGKAFGTFTVEGWLARLSYRYLHFVHERTVQGARRSILRWLLSSAMKRVRPQLKLH